MPDGALALAVGNATTSIGRRRYEYLKANSGLLRAVACTNAVTLAPAPLPAQPAAPVAAPAAPTLIRPIRKGAPTELALF